MSSIDRATLLLMKSSLSIRRTYIPFGYSSEYELRCELQPWQLPNFAFAVLSNFLDPAFLLRSTIEDLKGRDPELLIDPSISTNLRPRGFELIFMAGKRFSMMGDDPQTAVVQEDENFSFSVLTPFSSFEGSRHIKHSMDISRVGLPDWILAHEIARAFPLDIDCFRIGLDLFEPKFGSILGITPTVTQTLLIDADSTSCNLKIMSDTKDRDMLPFARDEYLKKLDRVFSEIFSIGLIDDYRAKLKS